MPNWCYNSATLHHDNKEVIDAFEVELQKEDAQPLNYLRPNPAGEWQYDWSVSNWGTKWDVSVSDDEKWPDTELLNDEPNGENQVLVYRFNTAWSPAVPAIEKLSEQYPDLLFTHSFEEEQGWGGELEILNGNLLSESQYDWKCRECDHMLDETPFCEACEYDVCPSCGYNEADEPCEEHKDEE